MILTTMKLKREHREILRAIVDGAALKVHRDIDGNKVYRLHPLHTPSHDVNTAVIDHLRKLALIHSNKKFPAATYLLTEKGRQLAILLTEANEVPLSARNFDDETER